jgi:hypothetical protein
MMDSSWPWQLPKLSHTDFSVNFTSVDFDPWDMIPDASPPPPPSTAAFPAPLHFDSSFLFGVATAPAHVEDELNDAWLPFCQEPGHCHAWLSTPKAEQRLRFWTQPEVEINLAAELGSGIFRMGVDWSRLAPRPPSLFDNSSTPACDSFCKRQEAAAPVPALPRTLAPSPAPPTGCVCSGVQDQAALRRYADIVQMAQGKGIKVALTLFHHSLPKWVGEAGGWLRDDLVREFGLFVRDVAIGLGESVDFWLTMNEPMAFALFTYIEGTWPQALPQSSYVDVLLKAVGDPEASIRAAVDNLANSHRLAYAQVCSSDSVMVAWVCPGEGLFGWEGDAGVGWGDWQCDGFDEHGLGAARKSIDHVTHPRGCASEHRGRRPARPSSDSLTRLHPRMQVKKGPQCITSVQTRSACFSTHRICTVCGSVSLVKRGQLGCHTPTPAPAATPLQIHQGPSALTVFRRSQRAFQLSHPPMSAGVLGAGSVIRLLYSDSRPACHPSQIHQVHKQLGWRKPQVGIAARAQILEPATLTDIPAVALSREFMDFTITDKIKDRLDFLGLNYYGKEIISGATIAQPADIGYSEAGRAIDTEGLFSVLQMFHER